MRDWVYVRTGYLLEAAVSTGREATFTLRARRQGWVPYQRPSHADGTGGGRGRARWRHPPPSSSNMLTEYPQRPLFIGIISQCDITRIIFQMVMQDNISFCAWLYNILLCNWLYNISESGLLYNAHLHLLYNIYMHIDYITYSRGLYNIF